MRSPIRRVAGFLAGCCVATGWVSAMSAAPAPAASPIGVSGVASTAAGVQGVAKAVAGSRPGAPVPEGWRLAYEQHFDAAESLSGWVFTDPAAWRWSADGESRSLELVRQSAYQPPVRSPFNLAVVADRVFGDFVLEVDLVQTGKEYGHRDMVLAFGIQDPSHFYYVHLATKADDHAHNVFRVDGAPRVKFARETTDGVAWGLGVWHRVRLERRVSEGVVNVYFDDMSRPVMVAEDRTFGVGWIGFGSFDDTGKVDSIRVWAPGEPEVKAAPFFRKAGS